MQADIFSTIKFNIMEQDSSTEEMKTLAECLNKMVLKGYTEDFKAGERGLLSLHNERLYEVGDVNVVNFYRFEGPSDPADNSILYIIETNDGTKGTLVDGYGPYSDPLVDNFIKRVEEINKKSVHHDTATH